MITKEEIFSDLNKINNQHNNFNYIVIELLTFFLRMPKEVRFTYYLLSKNYLNLTIENAECYNLSVELTNDFIQIQLYENSEMLIYFRNNLVINEVKKIISSAFKGEYEIENYLDSSNKIVLKKLHWNDKNLSMYNKEYTLQLFKKEFLKIEKHNGISLV